MLNKVILIGRLAVDPEIKWTPSGIAVCSFRVAVERPLSTEARQAGRDKECDFIDCCAWRQAAEFICNYLAKGRLVAIDGRIQVRQYVAQDGSNRRVTEVVVDQVKSLERPREDASRPAQRGDAGRYAPGHDNGSADDELEDPFLDE